MKIYTDSDGVDFGELPKVWHRISPITESWALAHGWTVRDAPEVKRYSKLKLYRALTAAGLWDTVKSAIDASSYADEWSLAQDLASDDAAFALFSSSLTGVTEEQKAALLAQCEED